MVQSTTAPSSEVTGHSAGQTRGVWRIQGLIDTLVNDVHLGLSRIIDAELVTDLSRTPLFEKVFRDCISQQGVSGDLSWAGALTGGIRQDLCRTRSVSFPPRRTISNHFPADRRRASPHLGCDLTQAFSHLQRISDLDPFILGEVP